jgi:hypothetical protein
LDIQGGKYIRKLKGKLGSVPSCIHRATASQLHCMQQMALGLFVSYGQEQKLANLNLGNAVVEDLPVRQ